MKLELINHLLEIDGIDIVISAEEIQSLWSGYGSLMRVYTEGEVERVILKYINLGNVENHPRGWNNDIGHQRKLKSYQVEAYWYTKYSHLSQPRLPKYLYTASLSKNEQILVLEDLDRVGFNERRSSLSDKEFFNCIEWLAQFHAGFLNHLTDGLWDIGTYWHLDTRPDELARLEDQTLQTAAHEIDQLLNNCQYKTIVHGDAKVANFCFSEEGAVAGVDFQYVGGGCGMKDLVYFVGSCLPESECEMREEEVKAFYFDALAKAMGKRDIALENEWKPMYRIAWADFHRFLKGWSPDHWKLNDYSERVTREVVNSINGL